MAGNEGRSRQGVAAQALALLADLQNLSIDERERHLKLATGMAKAGLAIIDLNAKEDIMNGHDERLDAAGEQRLRDDLLRRLDDLAAELEAKACAGEPGSGRAETAA